MIVVSEVGSKKIGHQHPSFTMHYNPTFFLWRHPIDQMVDNHSILQQSYCSKKIF